MALPDKAHFAIVMAKGGITSSTQGNTLKSTFKKILIAVVALPILGIALVLAVLSYESYQSEKVVRTALACDLANPQQSGPDEKPTIWILLIGPRSSEVPDGHLYAITNESGINKARDFQLTSGQSKYNSSVLFWNFGGAYYFNHSRSDFKVRGDKYVFQSLAGAVLDVLDDEINRRTLTYTATRGDDKTVRQCRDVEPNQAHEAVKAEQAKVPKNKI